MSPEAATTQLYEAIKENQVTPPATDLYVTPQAEKPARQANLPIYAQPLSIVIDEPKPALPEPPFSPLDRIGRGRLMGRERELAEASALWGVT